MIKKYEIINDGDVKRIKALRSFHVQGRYVNIGDVGGIVYDENTLSQEGNCWIFRGNFGFPGARIGGDSIVDVGEATLSATGAPNVDILGSSVVAGSKLVFASDQAAADGVVLTAADFEQGDVAYLAGAKFGTRKLGSTQSLRTKSPIFMGGVTKSLKLEVPGYRVRAITFDRDLNMIGQSAYTASGVGATLVVPVAQYCVLTLEKDPLGVIVPADATAAKITFTGTYETRLSIVDSRLEVGPATSKGTVTLKPGGLHGITSGAKYPESIIRNSRMSITVPATASRGVRIMGLIIESTATLDATAADTSLVGLYSNIKNLRSSGALSTNVHSIIQVSNCNDFTVSPTIFPGLAAAQTANMPFIFTRCNVPNGIFYHNAKVKNIYTDIDFAKASADLGKTITGTDYKLASSEVEGMYRIYDTAGNAYGCLVEAYDSVAGLTSMGANSYNTTIYKDAYIRGKFDFAGTNVFGNKVPGHPRVQVLNVQPRAVQGDFNTVTVGQTITSATGVANRVCILEAFRISGSKGSLVSGAPAGIEVSVVFVSANNTVISASGWTTTPWTPAPLALAYKAAYLRFRKADDSPITPEDLAGITVTVYNGCKVINTGTTALNMKGNIRVEDNAALVNASVTGSGYFGGDSVVYYNPTVWASLDFVGTVFMKDKAVFAPTALTGACALVRMEGNAKFIGSVDVASTNLSFIMRDNAVIEGKANTRSGVVMSGNSKVAAAGQITTASRGVLVMEDNASIEANTTVIGVITLSGNYKGNKVKTWTGKRTITDVNAPGYDDNVKTQYDF